MTDYTNAIKQIQAAASLDLNAGIAQIQQVVAGFSAAGTGSGGGVVYSGTVDGYKAGQLALDLANQTGMSIIDNTARGQFLADQGVGQVIQSTLRKLFVDSGQTLAQAAGSANNVLYGSAFIPSGQLGSISTSLWGQASADFAASLSGLVTVIASDSPVSRIFAQVEIPALLANPDVTSVGGKSVSTLPAKAGSGVTDGVNQIDFGQFSSLAN